MQFASTPFAQAVPPNRAGRILLRIIYGTKLTLSPLASLLSEFVITGERFAAAGMSNTGAGVSSMLQYLVVGTDAFENVFVPVMQPLAIIAIIPAKNMPGRV